MIMTSALPVAAYRFGHPPMRFGHGGPHQAAHHPPAFEKPVHPSSRRRKQAAATPKPDYSLMGILGSIRSWFATLITGFLTDLKILFSFEPPHHHHDGQDHPHHPEETKAPKQKDSQGGHHHHAHDGPCNHAHGCDHPHHHAH